MTAFEDRLDALARERHARIRAEDSTLPLPKLDGEDDGFLSPDAAARQMGRSVSDVLRLASQGVLAHKGSGYGLRIRPALVSGAVPAASPVRARRSSASVARDVELAHGRDERPHAGLVDED